MNVRAFDCSLIRSLPLAFVLALIAFFASLIHAADEGVVIAPASDEAERAIQSFKLPAGSKMTLVAAEPDLANPVAFCFDEHGRIYVAETFRQGNGVEDNRGHMNWLEDDLALQTVEQRGEMFRKFLGDKVNDWTKYPDRIRRLEDKDGDGRYETATVFAGAFNDILDGTGSGVIARRGNVWYTCIPNLYKFRDDNRDGRADQDEILHHGYGVRVAFRGHDMHGLVWGPDGRLYYSIGDRGYNVETKEGTRLIRPDSGAVFRCEPDGSNLEVYAYGLRNPQELAFNDEGDLFTGDNNSDGGDRARWVYVAPQGDTGWRMYYQYISDRGPWNRERMWHPHRDDEKTAAIQPAFVVPPIVNLGDGPSGLAFDPGVGLPEEHRGKFFLVDFRGGPSNSGIRSFRAKQKGAGFELADSGWFLERMLATDVDFGPDGAIYALDWVNGWNGEGKGRIYRLQLDAAKPPTPSLADLLKSGFEKQSDDELISLLAHPDRRVRLEAQFELADRASAIKRTREPDTLAERLFNIALTDADPLRARHAVWAVGQIVRRTGVKVGTFERLLTHSSPDIRTQAFRIASDFPKATFGNGETWSTESLVAGLGDPEPRARFHAAIAMGKHGDESHVDALLAMLAENKDEDPFLRHAAVIGLTASHPAMLYAKAGHSSPSARLGLVLALRRLRFNAIERFLDDPDFTVVAEAGRAIHDLAINDGLFALAEQARRPGFADIARTAAGKEYVRRVINVSFRFGHPESAEIVAAAASNPRLPDDVREEAALDLLEWANPPRLDRVTGEFRPIVRRIDVNLQEQVGPLVKRALPSLLGGSRRLRETGVKLAAKYQIGDVGPQLIQLAKSTESEPSVRVQAIAALVQLKEAGVGDLAKLLVTDGEPTVRAEARSALATLSPGDSVGLLETALTAEASSSYERQSAVLVLAGMRIATADRVIESALEKWATGTPVPAEVQLELLEAADRRGNDAMKKLAAAIIAARRADDPVAAYGDCLSGGDAERGRSIFFGSAAASCRRCHKINGEGSEVGPDLSEIGKTKAREYLLEAIVKPNARIAEGFETAVFAMDDGRVYSGIIKKEDDAGFQIVTPTGEQIIIDKAHVDERAKGQSGMPADVVKQITRREIRDLVEFLTTLKEKKEPEGH